MKKPVLFCFFLFLLAIGGCASTPSGGYYQDDGPHQQTPVDIDSIPEPVPRDEPLSESGNKPYVVFGKQYRPLNTARGYREKGIASWYGKKFHGRRTSNGESYDMYAMSAAHKTLPLPSYVRVRNLHNGKSVVVRVNDRGPFLHNRVIDLSYAAAHKLDIVRTGTGLVEILPVETSPTAPVVTQAAANGKEPRLYLQLGAFGQRENAEKLKLRLVRAEFNGVFIQDAVSGTRTVYRVRMGPLPNIETVDRLSERANNHGIADAHVVVE